MQLEILFEDEFIIVVNKPNNMLIHNSYYSRNIKEITLLEQLETQFNTSFYPIHRIDRKTSGVLALCKRKEDIKMFQELFTLNEIDKRYIALVRGTVENEIKIDSPVKNADTGIYKDALTHCKPIKHIELDIPVHPYEKSRYSLISLTPSTGRMHQLRIHCNKISHPIVGDYKYGDRFHNRMFRDNFECENLFLHAYSIKFVHPISKIEHCIIATLPKNWLTVFNVFNWNVLF